MNTEPLSPHRDDPAGTSAIIRRDRWEASDEEVVRDLVEI
jgi:hypothetical protein